MSFRKRNKIKIPIEENTLNFNKKKISLSLSDEESDDEVDLIPLKPKVKKPIQYKHDSGDEDVELKPKIQNPFLSNNNKPKPRSDSEDEEEDILYQDEINKLKTIKHEPKQVIMNMEDMVAAGEISDDDDLPVKSSERLNAKTIRSDEKEYFKNMDVDDKLELMDNLTQNGKIKISELKSNEGEYEYNDDDNNEFMDERLALSKNEQIRQAKSRRQQIEEALSNTPVEELEKENNKNNEVVELGPQLPTLYTEEDEEDDDINDIIYQNKLIIRKKEMELRVIEKEYDQLKNEQIELVEKLNKISL